MEQLAGNYNKKPVIVLGRSGDGRRFGYNESVTGFNYRAERRDFVEVPDGSARFWQRGSPVLLHELHRGGPELSGLGRAELAGLQSSCLRPLSTRWEIWIGTESIAAAHYDVPRNIACCVLGRRRFTLFRPEQIRNCIRALST